jgi:L,D-transpeptidase ErfK/SrfK
MEWAGARAVAASDHTGQRPAGRARAQTVRTTQSPGVLVLLAGVLLAPAVHSAQFPLPPPGEAVVGEVQRHVAAHEDTFVSIARRYGVGYRELVIANPGVDAWLPGEGTVVIVPTRFVLPDAPRRGIVLNVPEMRLYYYPPAADGAQRVVMTFPVSVGRQDWSTPYGMTSVVAKQRDPSWYPPKSIREEHAAAGDPLPAVVPPGPDNPLGRHALRLGLPSYLIHGTNKPAGVGMRVTHGCVRMFPDDIERLYGLVGVGVDVNIVNQPYKMGWQQDELFVEVHPPLEEDAVTRSRGMTALTELFVATTEDRRWDVDWERLASLHDAKRGIAESLAVNQIPAAAATPGSRAAMAGSGAAGDDGRTPGGNR